MAPDAGRGTRWAISAVVVGLFAVILTAGLFFARFERLQQAEYLALNAVMAREVAAFIEAREEALLKVLQSYAGRFRFRELVKRRDRPEALIHLRQLAETFPEVDRPFLADPRGVLWAIYPEAPQSLGRSFADRDWYKGVSRAWQPYMSEVYEQFRDGALAVALAVPIRDPDGTVIGILVSPQRLETIRRWLLPIQVPGGDLYVVDRKGQLVFHRIRTGPERLGDYARVPIVERLLRREEGMAETENPVEGETSLTAFRLIPSLGWGLVVHREKNLALQQMRQLFLISGGAGLLLVAALTVLGFVALRNHHEAERALQALEVKTRQLQEAQGELVRKERLAIVGMLAGGVSHELKNPLGVVKNSVYYLKMILPQDERVAKHLQILEREVGTASRIVNDLLDFARVKPSVRVLTDLSGLAREVVEQAPPSENIRLVLNLAGDLPSISVDPDQVRQVVGNLVTNAIQAMPDGGTLTVETSPADGGAQVVVSDTGVGIPPENLEKIFQPLFTTKARGIGLGLAVAKGLAEASGGSITVETAPGRGSRFRVSFPAIGEAR